MALRELSRHLETHGWPRLNCMLMVGLAAGAAFLTSVLLLGAGLQSMAVRYGAAASIGYLTFVLLIRGWVWWKRRELSTDDPLLDAIDLASQAGPPGVPDVELGDGVSLAADADDLIWLVLILALACAGAAAIVYVITLAPALLAEALLDVMIAGGVYRGLRRHDSAHWTVHVLRRTAVPAAIVIVTAVLAGYALQRAAPGAHSIGGVWTALAK
jgi:hypothetical protein